MTNISHADSIAALRDAGNLEALYQALAPLNITPGWI